ncbi:hypothetical protein [Vibrio sp. LaRot3]|uniref:hypothetical protein n=1 Tax=Vibrio sp. LaRot3 TaxID=2998829 RepID=UPI0022CE00E0|nr:hypothetical protein [Vibrio sp. LaRot3]MDA0147070.1 hypothetical protein [Vibrio sp. LaRot3]
MQDQGLANFESIEEFRRAFLPVHEARVKAGKNIENSQQTVENSKKVVQEHSSSLKQTLSSIESYLSKNESVIDSSLDDLRQGGKPSSSLESEREHAQAFTNLLNQARQLSNISGQTPLAQDIADQLTSYSKQLPQQWQPVADTLGEIRASENAFYSHYQHLLDEKRAEEQRKREEEARLKAEAEAKAELAASRRKSLQKKLMWTAAFIIVLAGFIQNQMA